MDALAAEGIVFERAYSHVPLTLPAHLSMLTGLLPDSSWRAGTTSATARLQKIFPMCPSC